MLPYSSNFTAIGFSGLTCVLHEAVFAQDGSIPPSSTVAVTVWPPSPAVSTVMDDVPWPLLIVPVETVQLYVTFMSPAPEALKVIGAPSSTSAGQLTDTVGQGGTQPMHSPMVTVAVPGTMCPFPSFTLTPPSYLPPCCPERSHCT